MKKVGLILILLIIFVPNNVNAQRRCCSHHGGVAGCSSNGRQICGDGTLSPTCRCGSSGGSSSSYSSRPKSVYGCTDPNAFNYNSNANVNDGSCIAKKLGCMDLSAINYDSNANISDSSCQYKKEIVETEKIKYKTKYKKNSRKYEGKKRVIKKGKNGKLNVTYSVIYDNEGNVLSKEKVSEEVIIKATNRIIEKGTKKKSFLMRLFE